MVNKTLFKTQPGRIVPQADTVNEAGGKAYKMEAKHALAQYVCTGCLNGTYYTTARTQLDEVTKLIQQVEPDFVGKVAVYGHQKSFMKDLPALLCAYLASDSGTRKGPTTPEQLRKLEVLKKVFPQVIDSGNMLRNFVQIVRSNAFGRKSFGEGPRGLVNDWFERRSPASIFHQSIGNNPTLGEIIKMTHPKPNTDEKAALFAYLLGAEVETVEGRKVLRRYYLDRTTQEKKIAYEQSFDNLPQIVREYEAWKADKSQPMPALNFRFLDNVPLSTEQWTEIARNANWLTTLKNLNAYADHGVFNQKGMTELIAQRLANGEEITRVRVFPYQIMMSFLATDMKGQVPTSVKNALQDAMEVATKNVPSFNGKVYVCPDVSGSMGGAAITGNRGSATSKVRCVDVAALIAACVLRTNQDAEVIPFEQSVIHPHQLRLNSRDSIMTNAQKLASVGGGGTNCSAPLALLNQNKAKGDVVIFISDYESWVDSGYSYYGNRGTEMLRQWEIFKSRNPKAKLICIDLVPRGNSQVKEHEDILQVGGFSDNVFNVAARFVEGGWSKNFWVQEIEKISLEG